jgi:hypothetical protein
MYIKDSIQYPLHSIRIAHPNMSIPDGADLTDLGYFAISPVAAPTPNPGERVTAGDPEEVAPGQWRETWIVTTIPVAELQQTKLSELAALRYQHETAGITMNGMTIETDRESQALITGAWAAAVINPSVLIDWKGVNGWVQINSTTILLIALDVANHVQACFSTERLHSEAIAALETAELVLAYDLSLNWP